MRRGREKKKKLRRLFPCDLLMTYIENGSDVRLVHGESPLASRAEGDINT